MRRRWPPTWPVAPPLRSESHVLIRDVIMLGPGVSRYGQPCGAVLYSGQAAAAKCHPASRVCRCVASRSVVSGGAVNDMKERLCPRGLGRRSFAVAKLTKDVVDPGSFGSSSWTDSNVNVITDTRLRGSNGRFSESQSFDPESRVRWLR